MPIELYQGAREEVNILKNLLFFDVDGTLLDHGRGIYDPSPELKDTLRRLRAQGDRYFISTGRSYGALPQEIKNLQADGLALSAGAFVTMGGEVVRNIHFDPSALQFVMDQLLPFDPLILLECGFELYANKWAPEEYAELMEVFKIDLANIQVFQDYHDLKVNKLSVTLKRAEDIQCMADFGDMGITVLPQPAPLSYDITLTGATKQDGLKAIVDHLDQGLAYRTYAFGDSHNDLEMVRYADFGIAMGNACDELKSAADLVAGDMADNGIYRAIHQMGLLD